MNRKLALLLVAAVVLLSVTGPIRAEGSDAAGDSRLRQSLRDTMMQLRQAQSDLAAAQAAQAAQADDVKALRDQVALLTKHSAEDKTDAVKVTEALRAKLADRDAEIARLERSLEEWKAASEKLNQTAKATRDRLAKEFGNAVVLEKQVEDLKAKNVELYRIGSEILDRYEKFSLGQQFLAREPFIGRARVDLENQIQEYQDQMSAEKATP